MKMLEYETANPGQDSSKPKGEHFDPDLDTSHPRVSFAPEDYAAAEEGRSHGAPVEYGTEPRPLSSSPAPTHPNDQYRGLADGGMHAEEVVKPVHTGGSSSDRTLASVGGATSPVVGHKSAIKQGRRTSNPTNGNEGSVRTNTYNNRNMTGDAGHYAEYYEK